MMQPVKWPHPALKGRSFAWVFALYLVMFSASALWGKWVDLPVEYARALLAASGWLPFALFLVTGFVVDGRWVASHSCRERPGPYALCLALGVALGVFFTFAATRSIATG